MEQPTVEQPVVDIIDIPAGKVYKDRAIYLGTFLGGPLVAGYLIASNFRVFNEPDKARKAWIYSILATVVIFGGVFMIPDSVKIPRQVIPLAYTYAAFYLVRHFQGVQLQSFLNRGGQFYSWWRAIAVGLIGLAIILAAIFGIAYFTADFTV